MSLRTRDFTLLQDLIEQLTVLCGIYVLCRCSKDRHTHFQECFGQLDRGLAAELYNGSVRMLDVDDIFYIFRCQRLEIQFICDIEVGADGLRVVVDDDGLIALFLECPGTMYGAEVKLDTLSDTDRPEPRTRTFFLSFVSTASFSPPYTE